MTERKVWDCNKCDKQIDGVDDKYTLHNIHITKGSSNGGGRVLVHLDTEKPLDFCSMSCVHAYVQDGLAVDKGSEVV